jgi:hypothetical protein
MIDALWPWGKRPSFEAFSATSLQRGADLELLATSNCS